MANAKDEVQKLLTFKRLELEMFYFSLTNYKNS